MTNSIIRFILSTVVLLATGLATVQAETVTYFATDHLGSPVVAMDSSGTIIWRESYSPYGEKFEGPSGADNDTGYTGHQFDTATDLTYMQARYYDPIIGRFLSIDPIGFDVMSPTSFGRYTYVFDNPFKYVDPTGMIGSLTDSFTANDNRCQGAKTCRFSGSDKTPTYGGGRRNGESNKKSDNGGASQDAAGIGSDAVSAAGISSTAISAQQGSYGGYWRGQNGKWYTRVWGGNGATGSRIIALTESQAARLAGRGFLVGSVVLEAGELGAAAYNGDGWGAADSFVDLVSIVPAFLGPLGVTYSTTYAVTDLTGGPWIAGKVAGAACWAAPSCL